ncbi:MAG: hypothetical protein ACOH2H_24680 [Cypionkella sp.]
MLVIRLRAPGGGSIMLMSWRSAGIGVQVLLIAAALLMLSVLIARANCTPTNSQDHYERNVSDGHGFWCPAGRQGYDMDETGAASPGIWSEIYEAVDAFGGGKTAIASLALVVFGILLTGSDRMRVRTYRDNRLIRDEIQGGVGAITDSRLGHFFGNICKIVGMIMFVVGVLNFGSHVGFS